MRISRHRKLRTALVLGAAVVATLAGTTGPAAANDPGAGAFAGFEYAPLDQEILLGTLLCANFNASATDPLIIEMELAGTVHGEAGTGTATFTATTPYQASPLGTFEKDDANPCSTAAAVPGTMTILFTPVLGTGYTCTTDTSSSYLRQATSVITLTYAGTCNGMATDVVFTGAQEPCPPTGCLVIDASSIVEGVYEQDAV